MKTQHPTLKQNRFITLITRGSDNHFALNNLSPHLYYYDMNLVPSPQLIFTNLGFKVFIPRYTLSKLYPICSICNPNWCPKHNPNHHYNIRALKKELQKCRQTRLEFRGRRDIVSFLGQHF